MSFRKYGGTNYAARNNIIKNNYCNSSNLSVMKQVGQPDSHITFQSDINCLGSLYVTENINAYEVYLTGPIVDAGNSVVPKSYVDGIGAGIHPTIACQCASTSSAITLSGLYTIDGYTVLDGNRVLVNNQNGDGTSSINNGIYVASSGTWSRADDCSGNNVQGQSTFIQFGSSNSKKTFVQNASGVSPAIAGTDPLLYILFNTLNLELGNGLLFVNQNTLEVNPDLSIATLTTSGNITCGGTLNLTNLTVTGTITASSFNATSDYRIKENVVLIDSKLFSVDNLRPVIYTNKISGNQDMGFIAHELQEFYPFLVTGEKDGEQNQTVNYIGLIALLVKEIQKLKEEVKLLKEK